MQPKAAAEFERMLMDAIAGLREANRRLAPFSPLPSDSGQRHLTLIEGDDDDAA
jgi:hypothetical protein